MVLRRVKDRVRSKFNAAIAEVDDNDVWQRGVVGLALVGNDRRFVESALDEVCASCATWPKRPTWNARF